MTFVFQDSTEIPIQKNFIDDITIFLDLVEKILPVENKSIELNNRIKQEEARYLEDISIMDNFITELTDVLHELSNKYVLASTEKCKEKLKENCTTCIEKHKEQLKTSLDDLTRRSRDELAQIAEQIRIELEPFLWSRIYTANKTQLIISNLEKMNGTIKLNINGFSYTYATKYADSKLQIKKFIDEISIPFWSKSGLIQKEDRIKYLDISEYYIKRIYSGEEFQMDLENKKGTRKVNIRVHGEIRYLIVKFAEEEAVDITSDEDLLSQLDFTILDKLIKKIKEYIENENKIISKTLVNVEIDEKDAIANNEVFDCMKIIASQYGEIIKDIFSHGLSKNEIIIKEVKDDDERKELFLSVDEISNRLSALGGDGLELKDLLNL